MKTWTTRKLKEVIATEGTMNNGKGRYDGDFCIGAITDYHRELWRRSDLTDYREPRTLPPIPSHGVPLPVESIDGPPPIPEHVALPPVIVDDSESWEVPW